MNLVGLHTCAGQLIGVRERQVHMRTSGGAGLKPPGERFLPVSRGTKRVDDLASNFTATCAEAGPNGGDQIDRSGSERLLHRTHHRAGGALHSTSPAGMRGPDGPAMGVGQENRGAVGDAHANCTGCIITDDRIGFGTVPRRSAPGSRDRDIGAMYLSNEQQPAGDNADLAGHRFPRGILSCQTNVPCREEMVGDVEQGQASQHRAPR